MLVDGDAVDFAAVGVEGIEGEGDVAGWAAYGLDGDSEVARGGIGDPAQQKGVGLANRSLGAGLEVGLSDELLSGREGGEEEEGGEQEREARRWERGGDGRRRLMRWTLFHGDKLIWMGTG